MDAQKIQKSHRLQKLLSLGLQFLSIFLLSTCTSSHLKSEKDLKKGPDDLKQKMELADLSHLPPGTEPEVVEELNKTPMPVKTKVKKIKEPTPKVVAKTPQDPVWRPKEWPYGIGEKLTYSLRWGVLEAGTLSMEVLPPKTLDGVPVLHYIGSVKSSKLISYIYEVDDSIQSWVRLGDHLPLRQEIKQIETKVWGKRVVVFDQKDLYARYYAAGTHKDKGEFETRQDDHLQKYAQDIFGAMYFYRFVEKMDGMNFAIHDKFQNWNNKMVFEGNEPVDVPAGSFTTKRFQTYPRVAGNLEPKGEVKIWVKDDPSRMMIKFSAKVKIGSIVGELISIQQGTTPMIPPPRMKTPYNLDDLGRAR